MAGLRNRLISVAVLVAILIVAGGCDDEEGKPGSPRVLSTEEARKFLLELPYKYKFREVELPEGASGALAGTVTGGHHTVVHFGIALGTEAEAVPVPKIGTRDPYDYTQGGGFSFMDDMLVPGKDGKLHSGSQFRTNAQWSEAATMVVEMQEKLCKASTGEACPI